MVAIRLVNLRNRDCVTRAVLVWSTVNFYSGFRQKIIASERIYRKTTDGLRTGREYRAATDQRES